MIMITNMQIWMNVTNLASILDVTTTVLIQKEVIDAVVSHFMHSTIMDTHVTAVLLSLRCLGALE
jgi:hypothetical protein